jgi:alpha-mannosidase
MNVVPIAAPTLPTIDATIAQLRRLTQASVQSTWRYCDEDLALAAALNPTTWATWAIAPINAKGHIAWSRGQQVRWLSQSLHIPPDLEGYPLQGLLFRIALTWWAESAQVFIDGQLVQEGDLFDSSTRLLLRSTAIPGETVAIALRLVSPGHDDGALVKSLCLYESLDGFPEPSFVADELAVIQTYCRTFAPAQWETLTGAIAQLDWQQVQNRPAFDHALAQLRSELLPFAELLKKRTIKLTGHAHLDMAWLWPVDETWDAAERTFTSALNLQADFPELIFGHSTPALYTWLEHHRPELFQRIVQQVQAGKWEAIGGLWVEPELNLIGGESIARHLLYGQRYFQEKFGRINRIAWLPDTFGFNGQLPQLLKQGGIDYFVTQKLRWNDTTQFPHDWFQWQAPDGTQIASLMSAPIGEGIDPVKMAVHACAWEVKTGLPDYLWLPGVGDHGGGPTRDMLNLVRRWQTSPFFPNLEFTTVLDYLEHIDQNPVDLAPTIDLDSSSTDLTANPVPIWQDELYLEFHRGCYTTHGDQKQFNRTCEALLYEAELWSTLATIIAQVDYPKAALEAVWKQVLFNQFHDILPGTSIPAVFIDANQDWMAAVQAAIALKQQALATIAQHLTRSAPPHPDAQDVVIFNPFPWPRSPLVHGYAAPSQSAPAPSAVAWMAADIPAIGYRRFWLDPEPAQNPGLSGVTTVTGPESEKFFQLENEYLRIQIDPTTGDLSSLWDKTAQREVLSGPGNQLQAFRDQGQYWDAWNIDPNYAAHPLLPAQLMAICQGDRSPESCSGLTSTVSVQRQIGDSIFHQTYRLTTGVPYLEIATTVDWQESQVMVKASFPLALTAEFATYEQACGAIQRATLEQNQTDQSQTDQSQTRRDRTAAQRAQWEVPGLGWADLGDRTYGVSLFSDYKHGYDAQPSQLRLTLLRSPCWPNPQADRGEQHFTYAIYPHRGSWQAAHTPRYSRELSQSSRESGQRLDGVLRTASPKITGSLPPVATLLDLGSDHLMLMAFKPAEDNPAEYILRCYECHGEPAEIQLTSDLGLQLGDRLDLLERPINPAQPTHIGPWQIATFRVVTGRDRQTAQNS